MKQNLATFIRFHSLEDRFYQVFRKYNPVAKRGVILVEVSAFTSTLTPLH